MSEEEQQAEMRKLPQDFERSVARARDGAAAEHDVEALRAGSGGARDGVLPARARVEVHGGDDDGVHFTRPSDARPNLTKSSLLAKFRWAVGLYARRDALGRF